MSPPTLEVEEQARRESDYAYTGVQGFAKPYFDWKSSLEDDYRLGFAVLFYFLGQGDMPLDFRTG